jgi:hypothetical protein
VGFSALCFTLFQNYTCNLPIFFSFGKSYDPIVNVFQEAASNSHQFKLVNGNVVHWLRDTSSTFRLSHTI